MIDQMTLLEVEELVSYWHQHPPVHLLVAGFVGYKADEATEAVSAPPSFDYHPVSTPFPPQLLSMPGVEPGALPFNMPPAILDIDELMRQ